MANLLFEIIAFLADGKFHSGEMMAKHFNVSRVSIWNAIAKAEDVGIKIFSVRGKGYKLQHPISLLNEKINLINNNLFTHNELLNIANIITQMENLLLDIESYCDEIY